MLQGHGNMSTVTFFPFQDHLLILRLVTYLYYKKSIMATSITVPAGWALKSALLTRKTNIYGKWLAFTDTQAESKTLWYVVSMIVQGVLFLPIPAVLMYYFNAPGIVLAVTMILFFANIIAGMGGSGIQALITLFALSIFVHLTMLLVFIL
jgi:hypothetical protein